MIDSHIVRAAVPADAEELMRLRVIMMTEDKGTDPGEGQWKQIGLTLLRERLGAGFIGFVVDDPDVPGRLAACVVGIVEQRLPHPPHNPSGRTGYVFNVVTDPRHRRRGHARACMRALLQWYADHEVAMVDLRASVAAEPLYASLGFINVDRGMRLIH